MRIWGVGVSPGPAGLCEGGSWALLVSEWSGGPCHRAQRPWPAPHCPRPSSHHAAAEGLISLVGETGAVLELCRGEGSGRGGGVVST